MRLEDKEKNNISLLAPSKPLYVQSDERQNGDTEIKFYK